MASDAPVIALRGIAAIKRSVQDYTPSAALPQPPLYLFIDE